MPKANKPSVAIAKIIVPRLLNPTTNVLTLIEIRMASVLPIIGLLANVVAIALVRK